MLDTLFEIVNWNYREKFNGKSIFVDGIEYGVYIGICQFELIPVNEELRETGHCLYVPMNWRGANDWRNRRKSVRVSR